MDKYSATPKPNGEFDGQYFDQAAEIYRSSSKELTDIVREIGDGKTDRAKKSGAGSYRDPQGFHGYDGGGKKCRRPSQKARRECF